MTKKLLGTGCVLFATWACGGKAPSAPPAFSQSIPATWASSAQTFTHSPSRARDIRNTLSWSSGVDLDLYLVNRTCGNDGTVNASQFCSRPLTDRRISNGSRMP